MQENCRQAGHGLRLLFLAQLATIVGSVMDVYSLVGRVFTLVGFLVSVVALVVARDTHPAFRRALIPAAAGAVLSLASCFFVAGDAFLAGVLPVLSAIAGLLTMSLVCAAATGLLSGLGEDSRAKYGRILGKAAGICAALVAVAVVGSFIPALSVLVVVAVFGSSFIVLLAGIIYILFLLSAASTLRN